MKKGMKFYAHSYVILKNGDTIYLNDSYLDLKRLMESEKDSIELRIAKYITTENITIKKEMVDVFGEA